MLFYNNSLCDQQNLTTDIETESDYLVTNPKLVISHLTDVYKNRCIISAHFGSDNESFLTAITEFDPKKDSLIVDGAPNEDLNVQLLNSTKVVFRTQMDGIKVVFSGRNVKKIPSAGRTAFKMSMPDAVFWLQRRQYYRVRIPLSHTGSFCEVSSGKSVSELNNPLEDSVTLRIVDLSISGFAIINSAAEFANLFAAGKEFRNCKLFLENGESENIGFVIIEATENLESSAQFEQRIGCLFVDLPPAFESGIQRYMRDIERQKRNLGV
ncbi:MAG: flagellar brake protein [Methylomonas sp.]|jgi:c-di-GMP-binding flagellar brake protein YcgR